MDSGKKNILSGWCLFCSTSLFSDATTETDSIALQKNLTLIERYFRNTNRTDKTLRIPRIEKSNALIGTCENCGEIVKDFSKLYQEMKCIELKLNWKLDSLKRIVEKVEGKRRSKLKLRGASLKKGGRVDKLEKPLDELVEFQKNFVQKCSLHFKQSYPKLTLKRYQRHDEAATTTKPVLDSNHLMPASESSKGITDKNYQFDDHDRNDKTGEAKLKSPVKRKSLNSGPKAKINKPNKRVPEFRIPELETLEMPNASTCGPASTSNLKFEEQPILFDGEDNYEIIDEEDPLADGNNSNDDDNHIEYENDAWNGPPSTANDSHCENEISISDTFLIKGEELGNPITAPLNEHQTGTTSASQESVKGPLKLSGFANNDNNEARKKLDVGTKNPINSSDPPSTPTPTPENENVSRFRRRFKCSQCTLTFTSAASLESHLTSAHVQLEDQNDHDDVDGKSESELETGDGDDDAFSIEHDGSESNVDIDDDQQSEADDEIGVKRQKSELESVDGKGVKKVSPKCEKCEPLSESGESNDPWHAHIAKHLYLHTNGQESLTDKDSEHLNIKWSDLKVEIEGKVVELKEEFTAPGCGRKFALKENFDSHLQLHCNNNFKCAEEDCDTTSFCLLDLFEHENSHIPKVQGNSNYETKTKCARCKYHANSSRAVFGHYLATHFGDRINMMAFGDHYCRICNFSFSKVSGCFPMLHYLNYHDLSRMDDPSKVHRCEVSDCPAPAYFLTLRQLEAHQKIHHSDTAMEPPRTTTKKLRPTKKVFAKMSKAKITEDGLTVEDFISRKGAEFKCDETSCNKMAFFTQDEMNIHQKLHGDFKCNFCDLVENYGPNLCRHELEAHSKTTNEKDSYYVECPRCPKVSSGCPRYIAHHLENHLGLDSDTPRCLICGVLYFAENRSLVAKIFTHFKEHHDLSTIGTDMVWRCKKKNCKAYFLSRVQLSNHIQQKHCSKSRVRKMPCLECGKICEAQKDFSQHMLQCHPEEFQKYFPFPCPIDGCIRRCETEKVLNRHLHMSHPKQSKQHLCPVCGKHFKQRWSLKRHMLLHDEEYQKRAQEKRKTRNFVCDQCGSKFLDNLVLDKHKLSHSGPESWTFVCEICSKKCLTKQKLQEHLRTHTKEKPFHCEHCGASYAHRHNWRMHVQKNHGVEVAPTRVYKKVNERLKPKYVKKVGDEDGPGTLASQTKRRKPKRRKKDWEDDDHEESSAADNDF